MRSRIKKISLLAFVFIFLSVTIFGNLVMIAPARAIPTEQTADIPGTTWKIIDKIMAGIKAALVNAGVRAASYALRKIAYDSAVWIASGGKGQQPLAFNKGFKSYVSDVANEAGGAAIEELGKPYGLNLCKIPDLGLDLKMKIGLRTEFSAPTKPSCTFADFQKNLKSGYSKFKNGSLIKDFNVSLKGDPSSDFGIYTQATEKIGTIVKTQTWSKTQDRVEGQGFKPANQLISDYIMNPSQNVKKTAGGQTPDETVKSNEAQLNAALASGDAKVFPAVLSIFLSTLTGSIINNFQTKGILPFGACVGGYGGASCKSGGSAASSAAETILSYDGGGMTTLGRAAVKNFFSFMTAVKIRETDKYDLMAQLNSCPDAPGNYNCRAGDDLVSAADQMMTIRQAIDAKVLDGGKRLIPSTQKFLAQNNDVNCYQTAYCLNNVRVLRQVRILPLGFEIAIQNIDPNIATPPSLDEVVKGFDQPGPYYHLIDPNWVIKAPLAKCNALVSGPNLLASDVPERLQDCVDLQTCVSFASNGQCNDFAYCTRERNTWKFAADSCDEQYATCKTYDNADGNPVSYLDRTLDKIYCTKENVGCTGYSLSKNTAGWQDPSFTLAQTTNGGIYLNDKADSGCSANAVGCSVFNISSSTDGPLYLKKAPDYLHCYDTNPATAVIEWPVSQADLARISSDPECNKYSKACIPEEASCNWYAPLTSGGISVPGRFVPATISGGSVTWNDQCDQRCVGYNVYKEMPSNYSNGQDLAYIIPSSGQTCSAADEGCTGFTNLSTTTAGLETTEYYSYLRPCVTIQEGSSTVKTYVTYEGSKDSGFQLKTYRLVSTNDLMNSPVAGGPKYFYKNIAELNQMNADCTEARYKAGTASLDCRQFNENGRIYYRYLSKTIPVDESCTPYRLNNPEFYVDLSAVSPAACSNQRGYWDSSRNQCNMCVQNGEYRNGVCIYEGLPRGVSNTAGISQSCSASVNSCRAYKGNAGNNIQTVFNENFESASSTLGWFDSLAGLPDVAWVPVSTRVGEHSLEFDGAGTFSKTLTLEPGRSYDLTFWAYSGSGGTMDISLASAGVPVTSTLFGVVSVSSIWRQYHLGPFEFKGSTTTGFLSFAHSVAGAVFVDNVRLVGVSDYIYLVKSSLSVDPICDSHSEDNLPGEALGCEAYQDPQNRVFYLTNFSYLCREEAIGCSALLDTFNTRDTSAQVFNTLFTGVAGSQPNHFGTNCTVEGGKPGCYATVTGYSAAQIRGLLPDAITTSTVYTPADTPASLPIYLVANKAATCNPSDVGCTYAGRRIQTATSTYYATTTIKNDPNTYGDTLCQYEAEGCAAYANGSSISYFKDPEADGKSNCVYKTDMPYSQGRATRRITGWFLKDYGTCANNHATRCTTLTANSDCGVGIQCQSEPCYPTSGSYDVYSYADSRYDHYVGECPSDQNTCTEFLDMVDITTSGPRAYYLKADDKLTQGDCNGGVSQKMGCAIFNQTDNLTKMWNTAESYRLSNAVDNNLVMPTTTAANDGNIIIKVVPDRECGEWLECGSSYSAFDDTSGKYRSVCKRIQRCNQEQCGAPANVGTSTLNIQTYQNRDVTWSGMDYDGYSLFGYYPIEELEQMNFVSSTSDPVWRLVKKIPCGSNCSANMMNAYSCGDLTQTTLYPGGRYVDGVSCGTPVQQGACINHTCVQLPNGIGSNVNDSAPRQICRAYPETTSPFPATSRITKSYNFQGANTCNDEDVNGCECDYRKVTYGEGITRYWKYNYLGSIDNLTKAADRDLMGICVGGVSPTSSFKYDGHECSPSRDDSCGGIDGGGSCQYKKDVRQMLGWRGFCLENDNNRTINADPGQAPCLTWLPVESLEGTADVYNQHSEAGLDWHLASTGQYYCLRASGSTSTDVYYLELGPDGLYGRQSNNWGSYAWSGNSQARQLLVDFGWGIPQWSWWRERHRGSNYNHFYTYFGRAHVDLAGSNAGKAGRPAADEATSHNLANDHKKLVGFYTGSGVQAEGKYYSYPTLYFADGTVAGTGFRLFNYWISWRNDRYINGGAMARYDDYFNIAGYVRSVKPNIQNVFPVNRTINRLDIDRIEIKPNAAVGDINDANVVFYLFPNDLTTGNYQSSYTFADSGGTGRAVVGYYKNDPNQLLLFVAADDNSFDESGDLHFRNGNLSSGNLFTANGITASNDLWGGTGSGLCIQTRGGGDWGPITTNPDQRWHAMRFVFNDMGELLGVDTAYCAAAGGEGGGGGWTSWVEYKINIVYKKWCSNIVDGRINLADRTLSRTIGWTNRLFNLTESYTVPTLGYQYSDANLMFGSLDGYNDLGTQAVVVREIPAQWASLSPTLCSGGSDCRLNNASVLTASNGVGGREYSPGAGLSLTLPEGSNILGTLFANGKSYEFNRRTGRYDLPSKFNNNTMVGDPVNTSILPHPPEIHPLGNCVADPNHNNTVFCEELPQRGFSVNFQSVTGTVKDVYADPSQGGQQANRFMINFFMFSDPNQMPIRQVIVDWGDNNSTPVTGFFRNLRGASSVAPIALQCVSQLTAPDYGHVVDMTCDNAYFTAANTYNCSTCMRTCSGPLDSNCYAAPGSAFCPSSLRGEGCCIFIPRVQVKDNWGWCNGSCTTHPGIAGCYDYNNSSGRTESECVNLRQNRNGWTYLGGDQTNPGRIVLRPSVISGACTITPLRYPNGTSCNIPSDCASNICGADNVCKGANGTGCVTDAGCSSGVCGFAGFCGNQVGLDQQCRTDAGCSTGTCSNGLCKLSNGSACTNDVDCGSSACVGNRCVASQGPGAPCTSNSQCIDSNCAAGYCKIPNGIACTIDTACQSGACISGVCRDPGIFDAVCDSNPDCLSNSCAPSGRCLAAGGAECGSGCSLSSPPLLSELACQDNQCANGGCGPQVIGGGQNFCIGQRTGGNACNSGADCTSGNCSGGVCLGAAGETCQGSDSATADNSCMPGLSCFTGGGNGGAITGECAPTVINGSVCDSNQDCTNGLCDTSATATSTYQMCVGNNGTPCNNDFGCTSGSCDQLIVTPDGLCAPKKVNNIRCDSDPDCTSGICNYVTSTQPLLCLGTSKANGGYCHSDADCTNLACIANSCTGQNNIGGICDSDGDCVSGACFAGICINPRAEGGACDTNPDCQVPDPGNGIPGTSGCAILSPATTGTCQPPRY